MIGHRSNGTLFVTVYDRATRKKVWGGTYPNTPQGRRDAKKQERDLLLELEEGRDNRTISHFAAVWTDPTGPYARKSESTNLHYAERVGQFVKDYGHRPLRSITREEARLWSHANRGRHSPVRAMFSDATRDGIIPSNPFIGVRFKAPALVDHAPTELEVRRIAQAAVLVHGEWGEHVYAPLLTFAAYSGLRPGEIYGLEWTDIDLAQGIIRVERQFNQKTRTVTDPKHGSSRPVTLLPQARQALERVPRIDGEYGPLVFHSPTGHRLSGTVQHYYWQPVRNAAGVGWPFRMLRHHFGTYLAQTLSLDATSIARQMGHKDQGQTAQRHYIRGSERDAHDKVLAAVARLNAGSNRGIHVG